MKWLLEGTEIRSAGVKWALMNVLGFTEEKADKAIESVEKKAFQEGTASIVILLSDDEKIEFTCEKEA